MDNRVSCINPRCNRTYKQEGPQHEVICNRCFKLCPKERARYKRLRKLYNHSRRYPQKWSAHRLNRLYDAMDENWLKVKASFHDAERPHGIDAFLKEMGLE